jgi:uncharacterized membrane protein YdfJ with MMPL/SSD domain
MKLSTKALAAASARHPWRVVAGWVAVAILATLAIVTQGRDQLDSHPSIQSRSSA